MECLDEEDDFSMSSDQEAPPPQNIVMKMNSEKPRLRGNLNSDLNEVNTQRLDNLVKGFTKKSEKLNCINFI